MASKPAKFPPLVHKFLLFSPFRSKKKHAELTTLNSKYFALRCGAYPLETRYKAHLLTHINSWHYGVLKVHSQWRVCRIICSSSTSIEFLLIYRRGIPYGVFHINSLEGGVVVRRCWVVRKVAGLNHRTPFVRQCTTWLSAGGRTGCPGVLRHDHAAIDFTHGSTTAYRYRELHIV
jgi:hypothetical protein